MNAVAFAIADTDSRPFPDVILRSQFFEMVGTRSLSSEQRLMLAVLADAINVVQECGSSTSLRKRNSFNEAWNWIFTKGVTSPLSFDNVCDALGMDARACDGGCPNWSPAAAALRCACGSRKLAESNA